MSSLNFIILKVNGRDVSQLAHEDAVAEFLRATEPILVEVKRRNDVQTASNAISTSTNDCQQMAPCVPSTVVPLDLQADSSTHISSKSQRTSSVACQTEPLGGALCACGDYVDETGEGGAPTDSQVVLGGVAPFLLDSPANSCDDELMACHLFTGCLNPAIDIEEVTLQKACEDDYIGLTVSYSSGNGSTGGAVFSSSEDTDGAGTEVYISCILPDSVAGRDGRLRQGDQILQVNGRDVSTRDETEQLFAEDRNAVTLLVSRCLLYGDDEGDDDPQHACYEENDNELDDEDDDLLIATYQNCQQQQPNKTHDVLETVKPHSLRLISQCWPIDSGLDHSMIKAHLDSVNMEISALDTRMENLLLHKSSSARCRDAEAADESVYRNPIDATTTTTTNGHTSTKTKLHTGNSGRSHHQQHSASVPSVNVATTTTTTTKSLAHRNPHHFQNRPPPSIDSSTEHIYETIPEEREEQEPIYCSPYYSQDAYVPAKPLKHADGRLVEQWLRQNHQIPSTRTSVHKSSNRSTGKSISLPRGILATAQTLSAVTAASTIVGKTTSSAEDPDNSSSAYQTGGSCNSTNNATPLTLELTHSLLHSSQSTLVLNTPASSSATLLAPQFANNTTRRRSSNTTANRHHHHQQQPPHSRTMLRPNHHHSNLPPALPQPYPPYPSINHSFQTTKKQPQSAAYYYSSTNNVQPPPTNDPSSSAAVTLPNADTMYTNMANLQQTMLLQQRLFRQAMAGRQAAAQDLPPQNSNSTKFTAPSLSQYQFVSGSQQPHSFSLTAANRELPAVPAASVHNNHHHQQTHPQQPQPQQQQQRMEWKVKRRQDGTRYIVRRPVRSDRSAAIRAHVESMAAGGGVGGGATTTEDDTLSEVKIGRYWTKEERKRHYEKSRERRAAAANIATAAVAAHKQELSVVHKADTMATSIEPSATINGDETFLESNNNNNSSAIPTMVLNNNNTHRSKSSAIPASTTPVFEQHPATIIDTTIITTSTPTTSPPSPQHQAQISLSSPTSGGPAAASDSVAFPAGPVPADEIAAQLAAARLLSVTTV